MGVQPNYEDFSTLDNHWKLFTNHDDKDAFARLYQQSFPGLFHYALHFVNNDRELAKESVQELFTRLWIRRASLGEVQSHMQYMIAALRNILITFSGKKAGYLPSEEHYSFDLVDPADRFIIEREKDEILYQRFHQSLLTLSPRQKEIIYLRFIKGLSFEETAYILQITVKAAYKLSARALETMRNNISEKTSSSLG